MNIAKLQRLTTRKFRGMKDMILRRDRDRNATHGEED
jgi:hypothetical protein